MSTTRWAPTTVCCPAGSCPTVGIAGLALGGGIGVFGRRYGLTSDNLRALEVVTSDGTLVRANDSDHADMLWASRGGGGGNFGVVTSFTFDVHVMPEVTLFTLQYPWAAAATMLEAWLNWIDAAPDELWSNCVSGVPGNVRIPRPGGRGVLRISQRARAVSLVVDVGHWRDPDLQLQRVQLVSECDGDRSRLLGAQRGSVSPVVTEPSRSAQPRGVLGQVELRERAPHVGRVRSNRGRDRAPRHRSPPRWAGALAFDSYGGVINRVGERCDRVRAP